MPSPLVISSVHELIAYRDRIREESGFSLHEIAVSDQEEWLLDKDVLRHRTGGFFNVCGYKSDDTNEEHMVLFQPQGAFNGLIFSRHNDEIFVLIHARIEPGNTDICQYGPTILPVC